jgi:ABC-2 type transport system ATP-binding protein
MSGGGRRPGDQVVVVVRDLVKVYEPSPVWLRILLRTAVTSPVVALAGISLSLSEGEICAIVGPNGAGKSTLFRVLTGLTTPTGGTATICGFDAHRQSRAVRELIGFVPAGDQTIYLRLTCAENLIFHGRLQGMPMEPLRRRVDEVMSQVGLAHVADRVGFTLSAGMRARLQLARSLLHRPRLLVLDEPTAAVDPVGSYELLQLIEAMAREENVSVLLSSHRLDEIEALHDRVVLMDSGKIVFTGDLDELRQRYQKPVLELEFQSATAAQSALSAVSAFPDLEVVGAQDRRLTLATSAKLGSLLSSLNGQLSGLLSVTELKTPLRDLLHGMFSQRAETSATKDAR